MSVNKKDENKKSGVNININIDGTQLFEIVVAIGLVAIMITVIIVGMG